jgi:phosphoenolpyruvate carboxykinase (GTP)
MRVLAWMIDRLENNGTGTEHVFGISPAYAELNWTGLPFTPEQFDTVTNIDKTAWTAELQLHADLFKQLSHHLPPQLQETRERIATRLAA